MRAWLEHDLVAGSTIFSILRCSVGTRRRASGCPLIEAWAHVSVLERRKSEAAVLRDFEEASDLVICQRLGDDIADVAEPAKYI